MSRGAVANRRQAHDAAQIIFLVRSYERPWLLMQSVIDTGGRSCDGDILIAIRPAWDEIVRIIAKDPNAVFQIDPRKWEELIAASYQRHGFDEVYLTPRSGDHGRDVVAVKHGYWSIRVIESVKRYSPNHLVRAEDVRALLGVLSADRNAAKGVVSTTSDFAPRIAEDPFISPFLPHRLELLNGESVLARFSATQDASLTFPPSAQ